nr:zinc finger, CCHC-type [Tanacetum cinerariifolium]
MRKPKRGNIDQVDVLVSTIQKEIMQSMVVKKTFFLEIESSGMLFNECILIVKDCTIGHVFYLGSSPITWCSQKQTTVALSSCEAEFIVATAAACQAIWLWELLAEAEFIVATAVACQAIWLWKLLAEVTGLERQKVIIQVDNKSEIALSKNSVFHGRRKHIHTRYHFICECVENEQVIVEHVSEENQRADPLTKALARIRFKEMRSLLGGNGLIYIPKLDPKCKDYAKWMTSEGNLVDCFVSKVWKELRHDCDVVPRKDVVWYSNYVLRVKLSSLKVKDSLQVKRVGSRWKVIMNLERNNEE